MWHLLKNKTEFIGHTCLIPLEEAFGLYKTVLVSFHIIPALIWEYELIDRGVFRLAEGIVMWM